VFNELLALLDLFLPVFDSSDAVVSHNYEPIPLICWLVPRSASRCWACSKLQRRSSRRSASSLSPTQRFRSLSLFLVCLAHFPLFPLLFNQVIVCSLPYRQDQAVVATIAAVKQPHIAARWSSQLLALVYHKGASHSRVSIFYSFCCLRLPLCIDNSL
jgi:hypothetical protein